MSADSPVRILIIEDDLVDRRLLERLLSKSPLVIEELQTAGDLKTATKLLQTEKFDVILSDLGLPDTSGMDAVNALHQAASDIPLIVLSGLDDEATTLHAVQQGVQDYLVKGQFDSQVLIRAIRYAIERKKAERTLQEAEQRYRTIFENSAVAIMMVDADERLISWNKFTENLFGMDRQDLQNKEIRSFYPEEEWQSLRSHHLREKGAQHHLETKMRRKDGGVIDVDVSLSVLQDRQGNVMGSIGVIRDITERKQAEEQLDRSYSLLHATLESTADGLLVLDNDGNITNFNHKFAEMWKLSQQELDALRGGEFIESIQTQLVNGERFAADVRQILSQPDLVNSGTLRLRDGRAFEHYSQPQYVSDHVRGRVWSFRDITERKQVEEALRRSEERFRQVVDNAEEWIWEVDAEGMFTYLSPVIERILGVKAENLLGKMYFYDLFHAEERDRLKKKAFEVFARRDAFREFETKSLDSHGNVIWLSKSGVPILDEEDNLVGYRGVDVDITERRRIHEILNRKQQNLEAIFDAAPIGMLLMDEQIRVRRANDAVRNLAGKDYSEIINQLPGFVLGCIHVDPALQNSNSRCGQAPECTDCVLFNTVKKSVESGLPVHGVEIQPELKIDGKALHPSLSLSTEPVIIDGARFAVVAINDITDRTKAEKELRETMEIKSQFISTVSHELRTPLASMKEAVLIVLDGVAGDINDDQRHFLDLAKRNIDRLWRLINDVLDFQKLGSSKMTFQMESGDLGKVLEDAYSTMIHYANKCQVRTSLDVEPDLPDGLFDTDRIIQVLTNLISNAIKFTPAEGEVAIRLYRVEEEFVIKVQDTGMGIPPEALAKIFDRFYRVSRPGKEIKGTGLGLAIVKRIIIAHGGRVDVESEMERGTTFTVYLPITHKATPQVMSEAGDAILENAVSAE